MNSTEASSVWEMNVEDALAAGMMPPPEPGAVAKFSGTVMPDGLQLLRARGGQYEIKKSGEAQPLPLKLANVQTIPDVYFWMQHGLIPMLYREVPQDQPLSMSAMFSGEMGGASVVATEPN